MEQERACIACGAYLAGPFRPPIGLTFAAPAEDSEQTPLKVSAQSWVCPGCGLVHWYAGEEDLDSLLQVVLAGEPAEAEPGEGYERRIQMLRMLRRVQRM
jgi:hypothetical protein